jgi:hypothetical protein
MIHSNHSSMRLVSLFMFAGFTLAGSLGAAGCGGGDSGPPGKLSEAVIDSIHRSCQKGFDCKSSYLPAMHNNETFENFMGGATVDACENTRETFVKTFGGQDFFTKLDASVTANRIKYSSTDYETCRKAFEAQTCDQLFEQNGATATPPAACGTYQVGQVATGAACTLDDDCATANNSCDATAHTCGI